MIILKPGGGLGNQLFQYAFSRELQYLTGDDIILEIFNYKKSKLRNLSMLRLNLSNNVKISEGILEKYYYIKSKVFRTIFEKICKYSFYDTEGFYKMSQKGFYTSRNPIEYTDFPISEKREKYVRGFFQSDKYFKDVSDILMSELRVKGEPSKKNKKIIDEMNECNSICVHIRGGDYIGNTLYEVCHEEYYYKAMNLIASKVKNPVFYIFSNSNEDFERIKKVYKFKYEVIYLNCENEDYEDLRLMYNCKHFIIPNSTFSWWGQYLSYNPDKIVIAPNKWYNNENIRYDDIYQENWIKLEV